MAHLKLGVLASGGGSNFQSILDAIARGDLDASVVMLVCNNSAAGAMARARAAGVAARHLSSATHPAPDALDTAICEAFQSAGAEILCLAGYMKKVGPRTLAAYPGRILNIHPALLPRHGGQGCYGIHVHEKALAAGDSVTGVTIHLVDAIYDHGRILEQVEVPIEPGDTPQSLQQRVLKEEHRIYPRVLQKIASGVIRL